MNGQVFFGEHKDGLRHCELGTMLERSGGKVIYSGGFSKGLYHGEGKLVQRLFADPADMAAGGAKPPSPSNDRGEENGKVVEYEGSFVGGQLYGYGALRSEADGVVYKGEWDKNRPSGKKWRIEYHDGELVVVEGLLASQEAEHSISLAHHCFLTPPIACDPYSFPLRFHLLWHGKDHWQPAKCFSYLLPIYRSTIRQQ